MIDEIEVCWKRNKFSYEYFSDLYFISIFSMFYSLYEDPKMKFENVIKIPVYDSYRMVLVFPSSPFPPLTSPCNLKVSFKNCNKGSYGQSKVRGMFKTNRNYLNVTLVVWER